MKNELLRWYSRTVKRRAPRVHLWVCRCASNAPLFGMRKRIDGPDTVILKGVAIGDHSIVATGSVVTKPFPDSSVLIAGNPAAVSRTGVTWTRDRDQG